MLKSEINTCRSDTPTARRNRKWWAKLSPEKKEEIRAKRKECPSQSPAEVNRRAREWRAKNPDKVRAYNRKYKYAISSEEFDRLCQKQKHFCAVCLKQRPLCVDHCHETGKIRGLLCRSCNTGLGYFKDDFSTIVRAANYIGWRN